MKEYKYKINGNIYKVSVGIAMAITVMPKPLASISLKFWILGLTPRILLATST